LELIRVIISVDQDRLDELYQSIRTPTSVVRAPLHNSSRPVKVIPKVFVQKTDQVNENMFSSFQAYLQITFASDLQFGVSEGVSVIVSSAITERTEQYFSTGFDSSSCVPVLLQRASNNPSMSPPTLKDPYGNLVVVLFSGSSQYKFTFNNKEKFLEEVMKIARKKY